MIICTFQRTARFNLILPEPAASARDVIIGYSEAHPKEKSEK